ncbi:MAG: late competence protein ComER [Gorillibacterium sp.]|nr:late competence protein ComER [Gorillibacterium sp.]
MITGFIGTGSMGSVLIEAFIRSGALQSNQIIATNRTLAKVERLALKYPGLQVAASNKEVAASCDILFICVKPADFPPVIADIATRCRSEQIIVSITSPVMIYQLENHLPGRIAKVIPSVTNYVLSGATLCIYGNRMQPEDIRTLEALLAPISRPIRVAEDYTRISSDLSSCGPAFMAFLLRKLIDAAVEETGIPHLEAERMACEMLLGTGILLTSGGLSPDQLINRVAVPGGITQEGLNLLERELGDSFTKLVRITHLKYAEDMVKIEAAFCAYLK